MPRRDDEKPTLSSADRRNETSLRDKVAVEAARGGTAAHSVLGESANSVSDTHKDGESRRRRLARLGQRALLVLIALGAVGVVSWLSAREADRSLRADLLQQARLVAAMIHVEHIAALHGSEADLASPEYQRLKDELTRAHLADPRCRFLYVMGRDPDGRVFFYADSEPPESDDYSPPGQAYEGASSQFLKAFVEGLPGTEGPLRDAWGTWVSAFVPLAVARGNSPAVLGMDVAAGAWTWTVAARAALPAGALSVALLFGLLTLRLFQANRGIRAREAELRESFQTSNDLVRAIPSGLYLYEYTAPDQLTLIGGNAEAERITGLHAEDWLGCELDEIWPDSRRTGIKKTYLDVMQTGRSFTAEDILHEDERVAGAFRVRAFALPGNRLALAFDDVTDRRKAEGRVRELLVESNEARAALLGILEDEKKTEESLRRSEERFSVAFRTSPYAITITGARDGRFIEVNDAFTAISGYAREEAMSNSSIGLRLWVDEEDRKHVVAALLAGEAVVGREFLFRKKDGEVLTGLFSAQIVLLEDEPCILSSINDITDWKRAEADRESLQAQLAQAQKMEFVGRLAGGVAHDFNNLLMGIMSYVELCRDHVGADSTIRAWLDEITRDAQRSADLTRQLLAFARKQTIAPQVLDLNDAVAGMLRMLRRLLGEDIDLVWMPEAEPATVKIDPAQLDQILVNLTVNARDAITGVGTLTLEARNVTIDRNESAGPVDAVPGTYVVLAVRDDGRGMSRETLEHVFEPFFTTKGVGEGTGLGLATVYGIIRQNGGFVQVESELGQGTTFRIYLPLVRAEPSGAPSGAAPAERRGGHETVLVVEDEKSVRVTLCHFLKDLGYTVLAAEAADGALRLAAGHSGEIHLLITDVVMPGMSGRDLAQQLARRRPGLKCLFISGYTADVIANRGVLEEGTDFLAKPFSRDDLARKVREVLEP